MSAPLSTTINNYPTHTKCGGGLFVTTGVLDEVGPDLGGVDGFLAAIRCGPLGGTRQGHCQRALQVYEGWRERGHQYPPYITYLSLFVLAAGHEGEFDPRAYYPRLWELLGEQGEGTPPSFERMWELWYDLEQWSVSDRQGDLGLFQARVAGGKIHIGLPLAQTILTEEERHALPAIFAAGGLEPGTPPSDRELRRALTLHGRSALRRRTVRALEGGASSFSEGLLDVVADYFLEWDGELPGDDRDIGGRHRVTAGLRLCLAIDRVARRARATLRCHSRREFPELPLELRGPTGEELTCEEAVPGWSGPIVSLATRKYFVPPSMVWASGLALSDPSTGWTLRLHAAKARAFVSGEPEQLPDLVETLDVPRGQLFYLAFNDAAAATLVPWLETDCSGWRPIDLVDGLPPGWTFGAVREALTDRGPRAVDGRLGFPDRRTIRLVGGIPGNVHGTFFAFAPPRVLVDGAQPGDAVFCDGQPLLQGDPISGWSLPAALPLDARIEVEVRHSDDAVKRRSVYLVSGIDWRVEGPLVALDGYGRPVPTGTDGITGAVVSRGPAVPVVAPDVLRTPGLNLSTARVYFVGPLPGQVAVWPEESLPDWQPVWAVPFRRRGRALFCGQSLDASKPGSRRSGDPDRIRLWQTVLWHWRKRITPPEERATKALWREFNEAARVG
jgi:hypothetical protein